MRKRLYLFLNVTVIYILFVYADIATAACSVATTSVNFGSYNVLSASPLDSTGSITVNCTSNSNVVIAIGPSPNSGGFNPRKMKLTTGSELLQYNLYTNSNRTLIWGNGANNTNTVNLIARKNRPVNRTVYGRVPPLQDVVAGAYNETLVVTITW
jgi:spore coat protein U-like protein